MTWLFVVGRVVVLVLWFFPDLARVAPGFPRGS
jgi:hypothetical protein